MNNLLEILEKRFADHTHRHQEIVWSEIAKRIEQDENLLEALTWMEETGGEPDLFVLKGGRKIFVDLSAETPADRSSVCYDKKARVERKKNAPETSAEELCKEHSLKLVSEDMYMEIQEAENLDLKTSSWLETPKEVRELGGAIFGDKRYDRTFIYHNGADSYYSARAFRAYIEL